jgi:small subunit ribosomal protein S8
MTDPIADMLTRIRNASKVKKADILVPFSKIKWEIARILQENGFLESYEKIEDYYGQIKINLKYQDGKPMLMHLKKISKPGRRVYVKKNELPKVLNDFGIAIISTSRGLMTNIEAGKRGLGGELLCEIY